MLPELRPASLTQLVGVGNIATQDVVRALTCGFEASGVPSAYAKSFLPTRGALERSLAIISHVLACVGKFLHVVACSDGLFLHRHPGSYST